MNNAGVAGPKHLDTGAVAESEFTKPLHVVQPAGNVGNQGVLASDQPIEGNGFFHGGEEVTSN